MRKKTDAPPSFRDEAEECAYWETHDSADSVDWTKAERVRLPNLKPSTASISLRLPVSLPMRSSRDLLLPAPFTGSGPQPPRLPAPSAWR